MRETKSVVSRSRIRVVAVLGAIAAMVSIAIPVGVAWAVTPTPSAIELPLTADDGPVPEAVANAVSCSAAGSCAAVGDYEDTIGIVHAETFDLVGGVWETAEQLAPVGPPDWTFSDLNSVSCVSPENCVAVGDYRISTVQTEGFYAVETAGVWARGLALPVPTDAGSNPAETTFGSVSCVLGGTTCRMLGEYLTSSNPADVHSVVDTLVIGTGLTGSPVEISQLAGHGGIELSSISCPNTSDCVAVGSQSTQLSSVATYVEDNNNTWSSPIIVSNPSGTSVPDEYLSSVSCVASGDCVAAGNWLKANGQGYSEAYTQEGGVWGTPTNLGQPSDLNNPFADSISCVASVNSCTIVGSLSDGQGGLHAATAQLANGHWGQLAPVSVPGAAIPDHELLGVSCVPGAKCTSVGYYNVNSPTGDTEAMAASWAIQTRPGPIMALHALGVTSSTIRSRGVHPFRPGLESATSRSRPRLLGRHQSTMAEPPERQQR